MYRKKYWKMQNLFSSNNKESKKTLQKWTRNHKNNILQITIYWQSKIYGKVIIKSC